MSKTSKAYWTLRNGDIRLGDVWPPEQWVPWYYHPNPIWHHRMLMEICYRIWESNRTATREMIPYLIGARAKLSERWDTTFCGRGHSNKSFTHYLTLLALDASVGIKFGTAMGDVVEIWQHLASDGCWREGVHYGVFCMDAVARVLPVINNVWTDRERKLLTDCYVRTTTWLSHLQSNMVLPAIGDGWPELLPEELLSTHHSYHRDASLCIYNDMEIMQRNNVKVVFNHRVSGHAYHEHPEVMGCSLLLMGCGCFQETGVLLGSGRCFSLGDGTDRGTTGDRLKNLIGHWYGF